MPHPWIAQRTRRFENSGIRRVFDLASRLTDPIDLSIGQPDFPVPDEVKQAAKRAIDEDQNGYAPTQGIGPLREKLQAKIDKQYGHDDREVFIASGTSGALFLAILAMVDPDDEVIVLDPYFVLYAPHVEMVGGRVVPIDTYPDFRIDLDRVRDAITERTKMILVNSPGNPTGVVASESQLRDLAELAAERNIVLVSDEIYSRFCYDEPFTSPARFNPRTLVIDGFSKSHAITGWRVGFAHGPAEVIRAMIKLQQYTFVCAPQPAQWAVAAAMDIDITPRIDAYRRKRDLLIDGLSQDYRLVRPSGAFYAFVQAPGGDASAFVSRAIENNLLIIPGAVFSSRDTHFRISYAAADKTIERGVEVLRKLARG